MKTLFHIASVASLLIASGCGREPSTPPATTRPAERSFDARGVVREVAPDRRTAIIRHEEIPGYMPRMNQNFQQAREALLQRTSGPTNWQFLCISFDPEFDMPTVLGNYARSYRGEMSDRWLFASASPALLSELAPRLDLMVAREGGGLSQNLRTVVVDTGGHIHRQFDGNEWTPQQLAGAVAEGANQP